jgi:endonuclease YncB( thermonuclease family)
MIVVQALLTLLLMVLVIGTAWAGALLTGPVTRVRDGDTIEVQEIPIRLGGLSAPERGEVGGAAAKRLMIGLTLDRTATCELNGEVTYDRLVGRCWVDGLDLAVLMIEAKVAARCPRYDPKEFYAAAQEQAGPWPWPLPEYCIPRQPVGGS